MVTWIFFSSWPFHFQLSSFILIVFLIYKTTLTSQNWNSKNLCRRRLYLKLYLLISSLKLSKLQLTENSITSSPEAVCMLYVYEYVVDFSEISPKEIAVKTNLCIHIQVRHWHQFIAVSLIRACSNTVIYTWQMFSCVIQI